MFKLLFITTLVLSGVVAKCESWEGERGIVSNMLLVVVVGGGGGVLGRAEDGKG